MRNYTRSQKPVVRSPKIFSGLWFVGLCCLLAALPACRPDASQPTGQIYVTSDPAGATLFCDAANVGNTPATIAALGPGEHLLTLHKPGYRETRETVVIRSGERLAIDRKLEPVTGLMLVHSTPAGADVELDGANLGQTPLFSADIPLGPRRLQISRPGYAPKIINLNVEDRTPLKIEAQLMSDSAELSVESTPAGATITLDNALMGTTPLTLTKVHSGAHVLDISLKGHSPARQEITLQTGEHQKISSRLKPLPGKLTVLSTPPTARIYLNDQFKAETPLNASEVPAGQYVLRAELKGYDPQVKTNEVVSGEERTVEFSLVKSSGTILIATLPAGINIYLDGEFRGSTKARGNEQISEQLAIDCVPKGQHKLQFTQKGYYAAQRTVDILPKQTVIIHEKLRARPVPFVPDVIIRTGDRPEQTFRGIIREKFANGDLKVEVEPGIFQTFRKAEIVSLEPIP